MSKQPENKKRDRRLNDKQRLDWLAKRPGVALVNDDYGRWAVASAGHQNLDDAKGRRIDKEPIDLQTVFWIDAEEWSTDIRAALDRAMKGSGRGK